MTFDTNNTGKYIFDGRQSLTTGEYIALEKEYYARLKSNPSSAYKNMSFTNVADTANQVATYIIIGLAVILPLLSWLLFFKDLTGQVDRETEGVVQLEGVLSGESADLSLLDDALEHDGHVPARCHAAGDRRYRPAGHQHPGFRAL